MTSYSHPDSTESSGSQAHPSHLRALTLLPLSQRVALYMAALALATVDGELEPEAAEAIYRWLDLRGLDGPVRMQAHARLRRVQEVRDYLWPLAELRDKARFECLFLLAQIAHADDQVTENEQAFLSEIQVLLGLQEEQLRSLFSFVAISRALRHRGVAKQVAENILRRAQVRLKAVGIQLGTTPSRLRWWRRPSLGMICAIPCAVLVLWIAKSAALACAVGALLSVWGVRQLRPWQRPSLLPLLGVGHRHGLLHNLQDSIATLTSFLESQAQHATTSETEKETLHDLERHRDLLRTLLSRHTQEADSSSRLMTSTSSVPGTQLDAPRGPKLSYRQVRRKLLDADVLMFRGSQPISRMLQVGARSSYSHCGLLAWWHRRAMLLHAEGASIQAVPFRIALHSYPGEVDWYQIRADARDASTVMRIIEEAQVNLGLSYAHSDLLRTILHDVAGMQLPEDCEEPRALFCSQYVARCFRRAGLPLHPQSDIETFPSEIALSPVLRFVGTIVPDLSPTEMRALLDRSRAC
jgi:uncharacterized tellurite resistance protein B-like protein